MKSEKYIYTYLQVRNKETALSSSPLLDRKDSVTPTAESFLGKMWKSEPRAPSAGTPTAAGAAPAPSLTTRYYHAFYFTFKKKKIHSAHKMQELSPQQCASSLLVTSSPSDSGNQVLLARRPPFPRGLGFVLGHWRG